MSAFKVTGILKVDVAARKITVNGNYGGMRKYLFPEQRITEFPTGINLIDEPEDLIITVENERLKITQETGEFVYQYDPHIMEGEEWVQLPKEEK